ncbi:MAG: hypothetical protein H6Q65_89 [Firmicutes bacterium]|nr:hypothetical protein [Bacillota bacterium]
MRKNCIEALHIASFNGNIGDAANHNGFRTSLARETGRKVNYTNLEIREFYKSWGLRKFDENFVKYANTFDLIIIGGGNFFELAWDYSATGTTIDISDEILAQINPPILFNCLGVDDGKGISQSTRNKFGNFLHTITNSSKYIVTVRNDGSMQILQKYYDKEITDKIMKIPDGGFFVSPKEYHHPEIPENKRIIAVNIAGDMPEIRYTPQNSPSHISEEEFVEGFSSYVNTILETEKDIHFVFVPHILKDYEIMSRVFRKIKDVYLRTMVSVAPCLNGTVTDGGYSIDLYKKSDLTLGMRYHSNICSIAVGTPTIGIVSYHKHRKLYEDIGLANRVVETNLKGFERRLFDKTQEALRNLQKMKRENEQIVHELQTINKMYMMHVGKWLAENHL